MNQIPNSLNQFSKGEIDRLGETIRQEKDSVSEVSLAKLQEYRTSHKNALSKVFTLLGESLKRDQNVILTYRLKRIESIIRKLSREPKMKFNRMWDIAGCRCILNNNEQVYELKEKLESFGFLEIKKVNDYIKEPQTEGYRSLHLYVTLKGDNTYIEIQIRCIDDHNWATLVEITDLLFDSKLKEYSENKELLRFHYLLSLKNQLTTDQGYEIIRIVEKYDYFEKLSERFSKNYLEIRGKWLSIESSKKIKYFLIETTKDDVPKIKSFDNYNEAEENYFSAYKNNRNANIVLTHLTNPNYNNISIAYSNYILTFHSFLDECYDLLEKLIRDSLIENPFTKFFKLFKIYNHILNSDIRNIVSEIIEVENKNTKRRKGIRITEQDIKYAKKHNEWKVELNNKIVNKQERFKKMNAILIEQSPKSVFGKTLFMIRLNLTIKRYQSRLNKVISRLALNRK